ncbi:MAG: DUF4126 domain-containing protein [Planctomycetes bacterium]|nr:DUF4126 domain-containing protein [Planctomycetota bacterium]
MELLAAVCIGLGLSAAGGLRVFVPLLIAGLAQRLDLVHLAPALAWTSSWTALAVLGALSIAEGVGYCVPVVDHALDAVSAPAGWLAGALLSIGLIAPELHSTLASGEQVNGFVSQALYATGLSAAAASGAAAAGVAQVTSASGRLVSTATTGGIANPFYAAIESVLATVASILAILTPIVLALGALIVAVTLLVLIRRRRTPKLA